MFKKNCQKVNEKLPEVIFFIYICICVLMNNFIYIFINKYYNIIES